MKRNKILIILGILVLVILAIFTITSRNKKSNTVKTDNSKVNQVNNTEIELKPEDRPYISLIPRADGHELKLKIENIPASVYQVDYELIYTAKDKASNLEIEKGVGDTIKDINKIIDRDLLLGTSSCTNGCKYAYDEGVTGGTLSLIFATKDGQASFDTSFVLKTSSDIKKDNGLSLPTENFSIAATTTTKSDYFILIKNYKNVYSVFSNGTGNGKVSSITPNTITKSATNSLLGDYLIP